jgi:hypothetical protein
MRIARTLLLPLMLLFALLPAGADARTWRVDELPLELQPWVAWALDGDETWMCPVVDGQRACAWPGVLSLDVVGESASFSLRVEVDASGVIALPGNSEAWPADVLVDGLPAVVLSRGGTPSIELTRGSHEVRGQLRWPRAPEAVVVPSAIGLVRVVLDGEVIAHPRRESNGNLWLRTRETATDANVDRLTVEVFRLLTDTVPAQLTTQLRFQVSGNPREFVVERVLPEGFVAHAVASGLPTQVGEDGALRIQLRPGQWEVEVQSHARDRLDSITFAGGGSSWPAEEIWSFVSRPDLRSVRVTGVTGVDPERTSLPGAWRQYGAWRVPVGTALGLEELRRGDAEPPPDSLDVQRQFWLGTEGRSISVRDTVSGSLSVGSRLEAQSPAELGRVDVNGGGRVITTLAGETGVEVREGFLALAADLQYAALRELPAVGWNRDARSLSIDLNLPPGWMLFAASGADTVSGAWVRRWSLLDLFVLLLSVLAVRHIAGNRVAALALLTLGLSWHERGAMQIVWIGFVALHVLAERLAAYRVSVVFRGGRALVAVLLVIGAVLFVGVQTRVGVFPQLGRSGSDPLSPPYWASDTETSTGLFGGVKLEDSMMAPAAPPPMVTAEMALQQGSPMEAPGAAAGDWGGSEPTDGYRNTRGQNLFESYSSRSQSAQADPAEVVQTGPGLPQWQWSRASLGWNGPVRSVETIRLWLLPPWLMMVVAIVRSFGLLVLSLLLIRLVWPKHRLSGSVVSGSTVSAIVFVACVVPVSASAIDVPSDVVLNEIRERLTQMPACGSECVDIGSLRVFADSNGLRMELEVHAAAAGVVRLPGPANAWIPARVLVNGLESSALRMNSEGFVEVRLDPGVNLVVLDGGARDIVALRLPQPARRMDVVTDGWSVAGWRADQPPPQSFELSRSTPLPVDDTSGAAERTQLPAWVEVRRELDLGVPWAVHSELVRLGPAGSPVVLRVPLLPGESVLTPGVVVEDGFALVTLEADQSSLPWDSTLAETDTISLTAPSDTGWTEVWSLACSPVFHCEPSGLVPIQHMGEVAGLRAWRPVWRPWPGESLTIAVQRPTAIDGVAATIDRAAMSISGGRTLRDVSLSLSFRSSQGGEHTVTLPEGAQFQEFRVDGGQMPARPVSGAVTFNVEPGNHEIQLMWREDTPGGFVHRTPRVLLDTATVNATVDYTLPNNRWLLWTGGPSWGPVVTIWQYVFALAIAAVLLARFAPVPMNALSWFVLGLGTSQADYMALLSVVAWLVLLGIRGRRADRGLNTHNFFQIGIVLASLPALLSLLVAIEQGLRLYPPDMGVSGAGSGGSLLRWYVDRADGEMPQGWVLSVPLWTWHVLMLAWALWVAWRFVGWVRWGWHQFGIGGLWKSAPPRPLGTPPGYVGPSPDYQGPPPGYVVPPTPTTIDAASLEAPAIEDETK